MNGLDVPLIQVDDVSHGFGAQDVLRGVSFAVGEGEVVGLLGPNGVGKTTLLKIAIGLLRPRSGRVELAIALHPGHIVGLFEGGPSDAQRSPLQTCRTVHSLLRGSGASDLLTPETALRTSGLPEPLWRRRTRELSQGMRQRAGYACVLVTRPRLLVLDEPQWGLDPATLESMWATIRRLSDDGAAVIVSSHLLDDVERHCSRVIELDDGSIVADIGVASPVTGVRLRANPVDDAVRIVAAHGHVGEQRPDGFLDVDVAPDQAHELIAHLVAGAVKVHECVNVRRSLRERLDLARVAPLPAAAGEK